MLGRALAIYRRIQARAPEDAEIAERIDRLERRIVESGTEPDLSVGGSGVEGTIAPPPRERLPWDPPAVEPEAESPEPESPAPVQPGMVSPGTPVPEAAKEVSTAPIRLGPMDSGAFAALLEGR